MVTYKVGDRVRLICPYQSNREGVLPAGTIVQISLCHGGIGDYAYYRITHKYIKGQENKDIIGGIYGKNIQLISVSKLKELKEGLQNGV